MRIDLTLFSFSPKSKTLFYLYLIDPFDFYTKRIVLAKIVYLCYIEQHIIFLIHSVQVIA